jgi:aminopeptidase N
MTYRPMLTASALVFVAFISATVETSERGIEKSSNEDPPVVDLSTLKTLSAVVETLASKKIVYVGEQHDRFSHHQVQLEILRALYHQTPKIAVGMEMFQRPFQKALDDYIGGRIDERTFLKQSEYFKRWSIDYNLYKPIVDFAKEKRLPVIALNVRREIVEQVAKGGLDSLSQEEKRELPQELDLSDQEYRARLKEVFARHRGSQERTFESFYQAQILWDETMAESIDRFLKKNPDFRLVVLAGAGHLQYGSGIPKRSFRRNGYSYAIVLNEGEVKKHIADFVVFPEPTKGPTAPRLMAVLAEQNQRVRITGFAQDSAAEKAGLKAEDILMSLDDSPVSSVEDVRLALFYKRPGETIKVKVRRGDEELEFNVPLQESGPRE